jgi:hypothetical protein
MTIKNFLKIAVLGAAAVIVAGGTAQAAVDEIVLGSLLQPVTFYGTNSNNSVNVTLGNCSGSGCSLSGVGFGWVTSGSGAMSWNAGTWTIATPASSTITMTDDGSNDGSWTVTGPQLIFSYGFPGTVLLNGTINLATVQSSSNVGVDFQNNTLTQTTGQLASEFTSGSVVDWKVLLSPSLDLYSLLNTNKKLVAYATTGDIVPAPEPGTLLLIGSGLVLAGGMMRRRGRQSAAKA